MNNKDLVLNYLDEIIPNPICELVYNKDYELVIAVMLSAQTTDKRVNMVTKVLFNKYDSLKKLKSANIESIKDIVKSIGSYNKKSTAIIEIAKIIDEKYNGIVPNDREKLEKLPMVGRKTVNVILSELFNEPNIAVDTHVIRISNRLGFVKSLSPEIIEDQLKLIIPKDKWSRFHYQMVLFGRYTCKAKKPICKDCKLKDICNNKKE